MEKHLFLSSVSFFKQLNGVMSCDDVCSEQKKMTAVVDFFFCSHGRYKSSRGVVN